MQGIGGMGRDGVGWDGKGRVPEEKGGGRGAEGG